MCIRDSLASVPTAVFKDNDQLYSNPLLFYQEPVPIDGKFDKNKSLNARAGLDYFMEDWMSYCNGEMDLMTAINVPKSNVDQWDAKEYNIIEEDNAFDIASELALGDWSYSNKAVLAVIGEEFAESDYELTNSITGEIEPKEIKTEHFEVKQTNHLDPVFSTFDVPEGYRYLKARAWYPCVYLDLDLGGFFQVANISIPSGDKDLQLYCKYDDYWMQTSAVSGWNQKFGMDKDIVEAYIFNDGPWRASVTDVPTKGGVGRYGSWGEIIRNMLTGVTYQVDIELYPGITIPLPDMPPFGCRDATLKLTWDDPNANLGFSLIGPGGEEVLTEFNESRDTYQEMHLDQLGEYLEGESYSISVHSRTDLSEPIEFEVEYNWKQGISEEKGEALTSATEGAVLASQLNAPLLYVEKDSISESTEEALYKLGVDDLYLSLIHI